jgi:hypothetical protein
MPVVALLLGVSLLGEKLTIGALAGMILIALGAWLATGRRQSTPVAEESRTAATSTGQHHSPSPPADPAARTITEASRRGSALEIFNSSTRFASTGYHRGPKAVGTAKEPGPTRQTATPTTEQMPLRRGYAEGFRDGPLWGCHSLPDAPLMAPAVAP